MWLSSNREFSLSLLSTTPFNIKAHAASHGMRSVMLQINEYDDDDDHFITVRLYLIVMTRYCIVTDLFSIVLYNCLL